MDEVSRITSFCQSVEAWEAFVAQAYLASQVTNSELPHVYARRLERLTDLVTLGTTLREMMGGVDDEPRERSE